MPDAIRDNKPRHHLELHAGGDIAVTITSSIQVS